MTLSDPDFVAGQYRDASNLEARIALHRRFGAGETPLPRWIFEQLDLPPDARILELGCGPGQLWSENEERIPDGWTVTLTDASPGMVRAARERLGPDRRMAFRVAAARDIPLEMEPSTPSSRTTCSTTTFPTGPAPSPKWPAS